MAADTFTLLTPEPLLLPLPKRVARDNSCPTKVVSKEHKLFHTETSYLSVFFISFTISKVHPHLAICQIFLYILLSADACHKHIDQVDPSYAKEASKHPLTIP